MHRHLIFFLLLIIGLFTLKSGYAQVGVNNPTPDASSLLDLTSTDKGFLTPRMTSAQRLAIPSPATGLLVFDSTLNKFYFYDGTVWRPFSDDSTGWLTVGNAGTVPGINFMGTTDAASLQFRVNSIPSGLISLPAAGNTMFGHTSADLGLGTKNAMFGTEVNAWIIGNYLTGIAAFGYRAGYRNMSNNSTFFGTESGYENRDGLRNSFFGYQAGYNNGFSSPEGDDNSFFGYMAGADLGGASSIGETNRNSIFGSMAAEGMHTGSDNTFIGYNVFKNSGSGIGNTIIGSQASANGVAQLDSVTSVGFKAGWTNTANSNSFFGALAGYNNGPRGQNSYFGFKSGLGTGGDRNSFFGFQSGLSISGHRNTFLGAESMSNNSSGDDNVAIGNNAGNGITSGSRNVLIGNETGGYISHTSSDVVSIGHRAGHLNRSPQNVFIGTDAGYNNDAGLRSVFAGYEAGYNMHLGNDNTVYGYRAGKGNGLNFSGDNTFIGSASGDAISSGGTNTFLGSNSGGTFNSGNSNTLIGGFTNATSGNDITLLGAFASVGNVNLLNATAIGARSYVSINDALVLGAIAGFNGASQSTNVGIGTHTPSSRLHVVGNFRLEDGTAALNRVLTSDGLGNATWQDISGLIPPDNGWGITGNAGTNAGTNFIGTTDNNDLVIRTNNSENVRINTNGNVGIGTTSNIAKLYTSVLGSDGTTNYGIHNYFAGSDPGTTYGMRNINTGTGNGIRYGIDNLVNNNGTGIRYGIRTETRVNPSSSQPAYGLYNLLLGNGTGQMYGSFTNASRSINGGTLMGHYTQVGESTTNTASAYGDYLYITSTSGNRTGEYKDIRSSVTGGVLTGDHNKISGSGSGLVYGVYNELSNTGNGAKYGSYSIFSGVTNAVLYGQRNEFTATGTGAKYGVHNMFTTAGIQGTKYGVYNQIENISVAGTMYGVRNFIRNNTNTSTKYGTYNYLYNNNGVMYGSYNYLYQPSTSGSTLYGVYASVSSSGTGLHYGGYFYAYGNNNRAVYGSNTHTTGWAGYFVGNTYIDGNTIINESGANNHDLRVESDTRTHALWVDANENLVRFGTANAGSDVSNGVTVAGVIASYVADFDIGAASGTTIGIGSVELLIDGVNETSINNRLTPTTHLNRDLGNSTTVRAWDDVFADNYINVSDRREKNSIEELQYGLNEVLQMKPVSYKLSSDLFQEQKLGLIAQEVLPLIPEAVKTHNHVITDESSQEFEKVEMERMGMTYQQLIPVLVNAIQELSQKVDDQSVEIEHLRSELNITNE